MRTGTAQAVAPLMSFAHITCKYTFFVKFVSTAAVRMLSGMFARLCSVRNVKTFLSLKAH